jgi:hypothetical protein
MQRFISIHSPSPVRFPIHFDHMLTLIQMHLFDLITGKETLSSLIIGNTFITNMTLCGIVKKIDGAEKMGEFSPSPFVSSLPGVRSTDTDPEEVIPKTTYSSVRSFASGELQEGADGDDEAISGDCIRGKSTVETFANPVQPTQRGLPDLLPSKALGKTTQSRRAEHLIFEDVPASALSESRIRKDFFKMRPFSPAQGNSRRECFLASLFDSRIPRGVGLAEFLNSYQFWPHVVFGLLIGKPLVIRGKNEIQVRNIGRALGVFVHKKTLGWLCHRPLTMEFLSAFSIVGIDSGTHISRAVLQSASTFNVDDQCYRGPRYLHGRLLHALKHGSMTFPDERSFLMHVHRVLMDLGLKAFLCYHLSTYAQFCGKPHLVRRIPDMMSLHGSDPILINMLASSVKEKQVTEKTFRSSFLLDRDWDKHVRIVQRKVAGRKEKKGAEDSKHKHATSGSSEASN